MLAKSPSARKVWIEIQLICNHSECFVSPSARKVWIEIKIGTAMLFPACVTFREEGVD